MHGLFILFSLFAFTVYGDDNLVLNEPGKLQLSGGSPVTNSPGIKPGVTVVGQRVDIHGMSRLRNLKKYSHSWKVTVSQNSSIIRRPSFEVCFHRNLSIPLGMCPPAKWEKNDKGLWTRSMSPFDHKFIDIRMASSPAETLEVSIEEDLFLYRIVFLFLGIILMTLAPYLSQSLTFYYSSAMAVGVILVILIVLFQVGVGSFLLSYLPGLARAVLSELGITEDMYNPLGIFFLAFVILAGAWMGFWAVRKLVLTEEGAVDISTSKFVAWSIRIVAAIMILQSSVDPILATGALILGSSGLSILSRLTKLRFILRLCKKIFKSFRGEYICSYILDLLSSRASGYESIKRSRSPRPRHKNSPPNSYNSPIQGRAPSYQLSESDAFYSTFHTTPEKKNFSKDEWEKFTKDSTKKALEELVSSPDFSKWAVANAERLTLIPKDEASSSSRRRRKWALWS